jgi:hypothetical protein
MSDRNSFRWNPPNAAWTRHQDILIDWPSVVTWLWLLTGTSCFWAIVYGDLTLQVGGGLECLHCSPASRKRQRKGNLMPRGITGPPSSWGYKYGNLALRVGGVSDETVKYGYEFGKLRPLSDCTANCRPVREGAPQKQDHNFQTATFWQ